MTDRTGHMGDTSSLKWGGSDALEGVFGDGRKAAVKYPKGHPRLPFFHSLVLSSQHGLELVEAPDDGLSV